MDRFPWRSQIIQESAQFFVGLPHSGKEEHWPWCNLSSFGLFMRLKIQVMVYLSIIKCLLVI